VRFQLNGGSDDFRVIPRLSHNVDSILRVENALAESQNFHITISN